MREEYRRHAKFSLHSLCSNSIRNATKSLSEYVVTLSPLGSPSSKNCAKTLRRVVALARPHFRCETQAAMLVTFEIRFVRGEKADDYDRFV